MSFIASRTWTGSLLLLPIMALLVALHSQPSVGAITKGRKEGGDDNVSGTIIQDVNGADDDGAAAARSGRSIDDDLLPTDMDTEDSNKSSSGSAPQHQHWKSWGGKAKRDIMILSMASARQSAGDERFCHMPFRDCYTNCPRNRCWCTQGGETSPSFCWV